MIGNVLGNRAGLVALVISGWSCAHRIDQDAASGRDGDVMGAKVIKLQNGQGTSSGIVTYPGGDRVDWKQIELPVDQRGTLELRLSWTPPRPGLRLAFDVFDDGGHAIATSVPVETWRNKPRDVEVHSASIANAQRSYYVRVYAVRRGDAGTYRLAVEFTAKHDAAEHVEPAWIPDPVRLPPAPDPRSLPPPPAPAPPPPPVRVSSLPGSCPTPPSVNVPACWATMPCPNPPNRLIRRCRAVAVPAPAPPAPVIGRVIAKTAVGNWVVVVITVGTNAGIQRGWTASLLRGDTGEPVVGGEIEVIRVDKSLTVGKIYLPVDQLNANDRVRLSPP